MITIKYIISIIRTKGVIRHLIGKIILNFNFRCLFSVTCKYFKNINSAINYANKINIPILKIPSLFDNIRNQELPYYAPEINFATKILLSNRISKLIDVGSYIIWYPMISNIVDLEVIDIRPIENSMGMFKSLKGNITNLPYSDNELEAISSLCVIEHIGLGQYGDSFDIEGDVKAAQELERVVKINGNIILSTMFGKRCIAYNSCRIYDLNSIKNLFKRCIISEYKIYSTDNFKEISEDEAMNLPLGNVRTFICLHLVKTKS